jgi:hypothetical protein
MSTLRHSLLSLYRRLRIAWHRYAITRERSRREEALSLAARVAAVAFMDDKGLRIVHGLRADALECQRQIDLRTAESARLERLVK